MAKHQMQSQLGPYQWECDGVKEPGGADTGRKEWQHVDTAQKSRPARSEQTSKQLLRTPSFRKKKDINTEG